MFGWESDADRALWLDRSSVRKNVFRVLEEGPARPSTIAERTGIAAPNVSRALAELREKGLVALEAAGGKARLYRVTERGEEVWDDLVDSGLVDAD